MKPHGKAPTEEQLFEAAELRAGGFKWEIVAERLHRAVETVRKWPLRYAERWQHAIDRAEVRHAVDSQSEAIVILRSLARGSTDDKVRFQAARAIIALRLGLGKLGLQSLKQTLPGQSPDKSQVIVELLERYSDEQLEELARGSRARTLPCPISPSLLF
jgi:hypothetical protein